jgi:hypothetical protein
MSSFRSLFDGAMAAWREGFTAARLAGKPRSSLVAVVIDGSLSPDTWPLAFVGDEAEVRERLAVVDRHRRATPSQSLAGTIFGRPPHPQPLARMPFGVAIRCRADEPDLLEFESGELRFPDDGGAR